MVSVVIPTYNRRERLLQAVESVLSQSFSELELIVVDDGSRDGSREALEEIADSRLRCLRQAQGGVSRARNTGIRAAVFPWIALLDSDDRWLPAKLERQIEALGRRPHTRLVHTNEIWIRNGRRVNPKKIHRKYGGWIYPYCLPRCVISPSSVLLHRSLLEEVGLFDEELPVCEDYDLWLRICSRHPVLYLEEPLTVKVGGHSDQLSRRLWGMDRFRLQSLLRMGRSGRLTYQQQLDTARAIIHKSEILGLGFAKRGKPAESAFYFRLARAAGRHLGQGCSPLPPLSRLSGRPEGHSSPSGGGL